MAVVDGSSLTSAEIVALVEADSLTVDAGLELLDSHDVLIEDITADFVADGSSVERGIYRTVHGTATLNVSRDIVWGSQRLRPYLLLSADPPGRRGFASEVDPTDPAPLLTEADAELLTEGAAELLTEGGTGSPASVSTVQTFYRFGLGVFLPVMPERDVSVSPPVFTVQCFDKLDILNTPIGRSYSLEASDNLVDAVIGLIGDAGESKVAIPLSAATAGSVRVMSLADDWTVLGVCNELLDSAGYRGLYVDRDGFYRSEPYQLPTDLPTLWSYCTDSASTTVGERRSTLADFYRAANHVTGWNDDVEGDVPVDGAGIHWEDNPADGPTSIDGRGGRIIRRVITGKYSSQAALVTAVQAALDAEKRVADHVSITVSPTPVHAHFDVVKFRDDDMPVGGRFLVTDWTLPLDGSDMSLSLRGV